MLDLDRQEIEKTGRELERLYNAREFRTARALARETASSLREPTLKATPEQAQALADFAKVLGLVGEGRWARVHLERAIKVMERTRGPDHPDVAQLLVLQAQLLAGFVYYPELEPLLSRALAIVEKSRPPDHPQLGEVLLAWAELVARHWHVYLARPLSRRALGLLSSYHGPRHPSVIRAREILTLAAASPQDAAHTAAELMTLAQQRIQFQGEGHPDVLKSLQTLLELTPDADMARELYLRALALATKAFTGDDPQVALLHTLYAERALKQQDMPKALPLLETALSILEKAWAADHPGRMSVFGRLTMLFVFAERSPEVMALQARMAVLKSDDRH